MASKEKRNETPTKDESKDQAEKEIPILLPQDERHRTLKVAVALAMIRSKPDDISADDYVRELAEEVRSNEARMSDACKSLEDDVIHLRQKIALMSVRGCLRSDTLAFLPAQCNNPTEKLSVTGERIGQHWAYLERYLSVATNAALLRQATGDTDIEELTLRSVNSLLRTLRKSPAIDGSEMQLCHKALSTLADMCDDGSSALASSLQAAVVDFVADCLNEIADQRGVVESGRAIHNIEGLQLHASENVHVGISKYRRLENISSWVGSLASGRTFTLPITKHLLDKLLQFASFINTLKEDQRVLEIEHFDHSFFLLQCTENAVTSLKQVTPLDCCELSETAKVLANFCTKYQARHPLFTGYLSDILKVLKERITICRSNKQPVKKLYTWLEKDVH